MTIQELDSIVDTGEIEECDCWRCGGVCTECWDEGEDTGCPMCGRFTEEDC